MSPRGHTSGMTTAGLDDPRTWVAYWRTAIAVVAPSRVAMAVEMHHGREALE